MAIAALVCGLVSVVFSFMGFAAIVGIVTGIVAIVLGVLSRKDPQRAGMATAGLILGICGTVLSCVVFAACVNCTNSLLKGTRNLIQDTGETLRTINIRANLPEDL